MLSSVTLVFPLLLLTAIVIATATACADEEPPQSDPDVTGNGDDSEDYHPTDGLAGHGGLFRALNWTTEELRLISEWHATVQYSKVIRLVEAKLNDTELPSGTRNRIFAFVSTHRPPHSVRTLLTKSQRSLVRQYHRAKDVDGVLRIIGHRLTELEPEAEEEVLEYLRAPHHPV